MEVLDTLQQRFKLISKDSGRKQEGEKFLRVDTNENTFFRYKESKYDLTSRSDAEIILPLVLCRIDQEIEERLGYKETIKSLQANLTTTFPAPIDWSASCRSKINPYMTAMTDLM